MIKQRLSRSPIQTDLSLPVLRASSDRSTPETYQGIKQTIHHQNRWAIDNEVLFTFSVLAIAAKLVYVDGPPNYQELAAFREIFPVKIPQPEPLDEVFRQAHEDPHDSTHYGRWINRFYPQDPMVKQALLFGFCQLAACDASINEPELLFLKKLSGILGINQQTFNETLRYLILPNVLVDPYICLGVTKETPRSELRRNFHERIRQCHPDTLPANTPSEVRLLLEEKCIALTNAYRSLTDKAA